MEDRYGGWRSMRNGDFQEEDVWAVLSESNGSMANLSMESSTSTLRRFSTASRMIPRANNPIHEQSKVAQQSAPVTIPDWSRIHGKNPRGASNKGSSPWPDDVDDGDDDNNDNDDGGHGVMHGGGDFDEDDDDYEKVPPHEWVTRKLARSQISSFSVFEGVGRTLKGRDLSRVRNAILSKTGFLE